MGELIFVVGIVGLILTWWPQKKSDPPKPDRHDEAIIAKILRDSEELTSGGKSALIKRLKGEN